MDNLVSALTGSDNEFEQVIAEDSRKAGAALRFILAQDKIGSEIVDNLNASIHLRAVLTDLNGWFLRLLPLQMLPSPASSPHASPGDDRHAIDAVRRLLRWGSG